MNFHTLSRKELQALCKKNKIPANITNVAMADALSALPQVDGLDDILNPKEGDIGTPAIQQRTTQRKAVKEPESSTVSARPSRVRRAAVSEGGVDQENKDANVSATPAMVPSSRRRAPAVSTRRKKEVVVIEDDAEEKNDVQGKVPKTPAAAPSSRKVAGGTSVQKGYSTRRSVRLLGKSLSEMSLMETEDMGLSKEEDVSEDLSSVSQNTEESSNIEKGTSLQTVSTVLTENTEDLEVSSVNKAESECQSHDMGSEVKSVTETENDADEEMQAEPQDEGSVKGKKCEADNEYQSNNLVSEVKLVSEKEGDAGDVLKAAEPHDSSLNVQQSFDAYGDSDEAGSELFHKLEGSCDSAKEYAPFVASQEASMVFDDDTNDAGSDLLPKLEESCESAKQDSSIVASEEASMVIADDTNDAGSDLLPKQEESCLSAMQEASVASEEASVVIAADTTDAGSEQPALGVSTNLENEEYNEVMKQDDLSIDASSMEFADQSVVPSDASAAENKEFFGTQQDVLSAEISEEVHMETAYQATHETAYQIEGDADNQEKNKETEPVETAYQATHLSVEVSEKASMEIADQDTAPVVLPPVHNASIILEGQIEGDADNQEKNKETEPLNAVEQEADDKVSNSEAVLESTLSSGQPKEVAFKQESSENPSAETEKTENSEVEKEVCIEDVTHQLSLLGVVAANEAEKDTNAANPNTMKENLTECDFDAMSLRGIKKKIKELDGKKKKKTNSDTAHMLEGETKRTALQPRSQNMLHTGEVKHDA